MAEKRGVTMRFEARLREHKIVPLWTLPDKYSELFNLAKRRGRAHFLVLVCAPNADPAPFLERLAPELVKLSSLPAQGIVVVASEEAAGAVASPPFTVVVDAEGSVRDRYLPEGAAAGLFALDRYADLYHQWIVETVAELPGPDEVAEWMQAIGMQCSV